MSPRELGVCLYDIALNDGPSTSGEAAWGVVNKRVLGMKKVSAGSASPDCPFHPHPWPSRKSPLVI